MPTLIERDHYARRAMEVRGMANAAQDPDIKNALAEMASSYDKLVEEADRIARLKGQLENDPLPAHFKIGATVNQHSQ